MDPWLKVFFVVVGTVLVPSAMLLVGQIWKQRVKIVAIEKDIAAMQRDMIARNHRGAERTAAIGRAWDSIDKMHRNIVRIGSKLELGDLES